MTSLSLCGRNYWQRFSSPLKSSIARATQTKTKKPRAACLQVYTTWANIFKALTAREVGSSSGSSSSWGVKFSSSEQKSLRLARWYSIEYAPLSNVYVTSGQLDCKQTKQTFGCYVRQIKENCAVYYLPAHLVDILSGITRRLSTQTTILLSALLYFMTS